jgi:hypothetical protein
MVIQAVATLSLLGHDRERADAAMNSIEANGRRALSELRRILGVLRHGQEPGERAPQRGIDQIYALIQHVRDRGQSIELCIDGEVGTLPASVELGPTDTIRGRAALGGGQIDPPTPTTVGWGFGARLPSRPRER